MEECYDNGAFFFAQEEIGTGGSHRCSHGCAEDLVDVCIHEIEGAVFQNEIQGYANYVGRWAFCG